nr:hypothetical protein CFP56_12954 [Quercus suber]
MSRTAYLWDVLAPTRPRASGLITLTSTCPYSPSPSFLSLSVSTDRQVAGNQVQNRASSRMSVYKAIRVHPWRWTGDWLRRLVGLSSCCRRWHSLRDVIGGKGGQRTRYRQMIISLAGQDCNPAQNHKGMTWEKWQREEWKKMVSRKFMLDGIVTI